MPNPHFDVSIVQRSKRQSAIASAAYQSADRLYSEYDLKYKDCRKKEHVVYTDIINITTDREITAYLERILMRLLIH